VNKAALKFNQQSLSCFALSNFFLIKAIDQKQTNTSNQGKFFILKFFIDLKNKHNNNTISQKYTQHSKEIQNRLKKCCNF
jgi:hypothetical protein